MILDEGHEQLIDDICPFYITGEISIGTIDEYY
jgi:hypothetical protein